jgi:hypothetical protein
MELRNLPLGAKQCSLDRSPLNPLPGSLQPTAALAELHLVSFRPIVSSETFLLQWRFFLLRSSTFNLVV